MTEYKRVFIDTAPFIYLIEKNEDNPQFYNKAKKFFDDGYNNDVDFVSSVITMEEYLVFPYRIQSQEYIDIFEKLIKALEIEMVVIDERIAKKAAQIRAEYQSFKAMDALQLAAASLADCNLFLTNDKQLRQFKELKCITVDELDSIDVEHGMQ